MTEAEHSDQVEAEHFKAFLDRGRRFLSDRGTPEQYIDEALALVVAHFQGSHVY